MANDIYLPYDLISRVMEICRDDYNLLYQCSLVNWDFNQEASRMLYSRVVLSPPFRPILDLSDTSSIPKYSNFTSASLPRNAPYVVDLEISGYISPRAPPRNTLPAKLVEAIKSFINLRSVRFTPLTHHEDLFKESLVALCNLRSLTEITVNTSCTEDAKALALVELCGLRKLTLYSPGRAILQLLPDWLRRLSGTLQELHLKGNCGSVTPGVLRFFVPHIQDNLRALTLGLSYSLTDEDAFTCLGNLPNLNRIQLRYYWAQQQMKYPSRQPKLLNLRSFTVTHPPVQSRNEVNQLCKWIRRAITGSAIEELRTINVSDLPIPATHLCFAGLFDHIVKKQFSTIRVLHLDSAFVGVDHLRTLLITCARLEELKLQVGRNALNVFAIHCSGLVWLHSASFQVCNVKRSFRANDALIIDIMRNGPSSLRRLSVNGTMWQSSWVVNTDHHAELIIKSTGDLIPPWGRY